LANKNPSPSTRFQPGRPSANPSGRPKSEVDMLALIDSQLGAVDPASRQSAAAEIVAALITAAKAGEVKAITALIERKHGKPRTATEQFEHERRQAAAEAALEEERRQAERIETGVRLVVSAHPEVSPELAGRYVRACIALMAPRDLADLLRERLGLWQPVPPDDAALAALWRELGLPGEPGPGPEPAEPDPQGARPPPGPTRSGEGLVELPEPEPQPEPPPMIRPRSDPPIEPEPVPPDPKQWFLPGEFLALGDLTVSIPDEWRQ
jgi:hypothetical protein